jgi:mRNA-degrading endonuclease RelE of RelBE toxin-antitoxin system
VSLLAVEGLTLTVGPLDLVDGTPILDIKPYLPAVDSFPESRIGWLEEVESAATPRFHVEVTDVVEADLAWLEATWGIDFRERAFGILSRDPSPHRTRRILEVEPGLFRLACGPWRLYYRVEEDRVTVLEIKVGYSEATLFERVDIPHRDGLFAFLARKSAPGTAE